MTLRPDRAILRPVAVCPDDLAAFLNMDLFDSRAAITDFLFLRDTVRPVDLAFVFGSPTISSILPAIALFQAGLVPKILITGASAAVNGAPEWAFYRDRALASGVPEAALLLEPEARNSAENAEFGAALIARTLGWDRVQTMAVCAKPFHMRRAIMTLRRHIPAQVQLVAQPPDAPGDLAAASWWQTDSGRRRVLAELGKISEYALKGDLGDV